MNPTTSKNALSQLQKAQSTATDPNAYLANQQKQLGVDEAQSTVNGLRGAINNTTKLLQQVAPSIMGRTANSLVTSASANRQIANEQQPIAQTLTDQGSQYGEANTNLSQLQDRASQLASGAYAGQQDKLSYLQNIYNTLYQREEAAKTAAEQKRQFNASLAAKGSSDSGLGSIIDALLKGNNSYSTSKDKNGGTQFAYNKTPVTAAQYFQSKGGNAQDVFNNIVGFLKTDKNSKSAYNDAISGKFSPKQLAEKYSYIFGGV